jgi:hypothetical protein
MSSGTEKSTVHSEAEAELRVAITVKTQKLATPSSILAIRPRSQALDTRRERRYVAQAYSRYSWSTTLRASRMEPSVLNLDPSHPD